MYKISKTSKPQKAQLPIDSNKNLKNFKKEIQSIKDDISLLNNDAFYLDFKNKLSEENILALSFKEIIAIIEILNKFTENNKIDIRLNNEILVLLLEQFIIQINDVALFDSSASVDNQVHIKSFIDFVMRNKLLKSWEALYFNKLNSLEPKILVNNFSLLSRTKAQTGNHFQKPLRKFYKKAIEDAKAKLIDFKPNSLIKIIESMSKILDINDSPTRILVKEFLQDSINLINPATSGINYQDKIKIIGLLGKLEYHDNNFITLLMDEDFINKLPIMLTSQLTSLTIGLSKVRDLNEELFLKLSTIIKTKLAEFNANQLINSAQSFAHIYIVNSFSNKSKVYSLLCELSQKINIIDPKLFLQSMMNQVLQVYYSLNIEDRDKFGALGVIFPSWDAALKARDKAEGSKFQNQLHSMLSSKLVLEKESWIPEIASNVDAYEVEQKVIFQVDGPIHCYINNENEYDVSTIFNTMILEKYGYKVIRISNFMINNFAKESLPEEDMSGLTLAQISAKPEVQEAILEYVTNLLPASLEPEQDSTGELVFINNETHQDSENIYLSASDQFVCGNLMGKCIISPFLSYLGDFINNEGSRKSIFDHYSSIPYIATISSINSLFFQTINYMIPEASLANKLLASKFIMDSTVSAINGKFQEKILSDSYSLELCKYIISSFAYFIINAKYVHNSHHGRNYFVDGVIVSVSNKVVNLAEKVLYKVGSSMYDSKFSEPTIETKAHNFLRGTNSPKNEQIVDSFNDENNLNLGNIKGDYYIDYAGLLAQEFEVLAVM